MAEAIAQSPAKKPAVDKTSLITGSEAIAVACKLADVDVITGYPIRPYDTVMQYIAKLVSNGEMDCEYIIAEGEHSAMMYSQSISPLETSLAMYCMTVSRGRMGYPVITS